MNTTQTQYTPPPWEIHRGDPGSGIVHVGVRIENKSHRKIFRPLAIMVAPSVPDDLASWMQDSEVKIHNATIIHAAPDMLLALERVYDEMGHRISPAAFAEFSDETRLIIAAALTKAGRKDTK